MSDLLFWKAATTSPDLTFGESPTPAEQHLTATLTATLPELQFEARIAPTTLATLTATMPEMTVTASGEYKSRADRALTGQASSDYQAADRAAGSAHSTYRNADKRLGGAESSYQEAAPLSADASASHRDSARLAATVRSGQQDAARINGAALTAPHADAIRLKREVASSYQDAAPRKAAPISAPHQDGIRVKADVSSFWQDALRRNTLPLHASAQTAAKLDRWLASLWQDGMVPPAGQQVDPTSPVPPEKEWSGDLLFAKLWDGSTDLVFGWKSKADAIIIPVREVYMVINEVGLKRVDNNLALPALSMSLRIDRDSWTWGFSASLPAYVLSDLEPDAQGNPVELEATVNGHAYRVLVESITRERQFAQSSISISGRGKSAYLDSPYCPTLNFTNSTQRTAQQLMDDALLINGVPIGWTLDWQIDDWLVPANVWSHQGSRISALKTIAEAAGAYLLPHPTLQQIAVKANYPVEPWQWATGLPADIVLPADLTTREGIEWVEKARYNGVYLQGANLFSRVKITGTDGATLAPMVVDPLLTHADAHRQRGTSILSDTGRIANVSLRIPVLPETGIIEPGTVVDYVDGGVTKRGIVRSTDVQVAYPEVFQSLGVETHA